MDRTPEMVSTFSTSCVISTSRKCWCESLGDEGLVQKLSICFNDLFTRPDCCASAVVGSVSAHSPEAHLDVPRSSLPLAFSKPSGPQFACVCFQILHHILHLLKLKDEAVDETCNRLELFYPLERPSNHST